MNSLRTLVLTTSLLVAATAGATPIDNVTFVETSWAQSANLATGMAWAPDGSGRLFVIHQNGVVQIIHHGLPSGTVVGTPFATVSPIYTNSECGLIGIAFDHDFVNNRYVYFHAVVGYEKMEIIRYTASGDVGTAKTTLIALPGGGANHVGGGIGFGPDNKLYFSQGDYGGNVGTNANLTLNASKVSRANRDGTVPNDNPFFDGSGPNQDFIFARGFRNPFTLTFQPRTNLLWVNVVGAYYEQVFIVGRGDHAGWDIYENNQPATGASIAPKIKYRTNTGDRSYIVGSNGAVRASNVVTFTTTMPHGFRQGERLVITGVNDVSFNGTFYVLSTSDLPTSTTFTVAQNGNNASSGGGTADTETFGGSITGGAFYDGTSLPTAYRGNFFVGDFNTGRINRAVVDPTTNAIASFDFFATGVSAVVDVEAGPDGALYYARYDGRIDRTAPRTPTAGIIVSHRNVLMVENGAAAFTVRLATAPPGNVAVTVTRTAGDADIGVTQGATLNFTTTNWDVPQPVRLAASSDSDSTDDTATLSASAQNLTTETVAVRAIDDNGLQLVLSSSSLMINEGASGMFTVALSSVPAGNVTVNVARTAGDTDVTVAVGATLTFTTTNFSTPQPVTIAAAEDGDTSDDGATISVTSTNLATRTVSVTARDNDSVAPVITTVARTTAVQNAPYSYDVDATGTPTPTFSLTAMPQGMTINATSGVISWTPAAAGSFPVTVRATNGVSPDAVQSFNVAVAADAPPVCVMTRPQPNEVVMGVMNELFGDCTDDVGCVRVEFSIDGVVRNTDTNSSGHYHFGGAHMMWNVTSLSDGNHQVRMTGFDTTGKSCFAEVGVIVANSGPPDLMGVDLLVLRDLTAPIVDLIVPPTDGGTDPTDGSATVDGDTGTPTKPGCACDLGARPTPPVAALTLLLLLAAALTLRRR